jgi:hypothetical protein
MRGNGPSDQELFLIIAGGLIYVIYLVVRILYLRTVYLALRRVHPRNRRMQPGMVWLELIPLFNYFWSFIVVDRVCGSLDDEFYDRRIRRRDDFGRSIGTAMNVCYILTCVFSLFGVVGMVLWIIYWVKIAGYSRVLAQDAADHGEDYDDFDEAVSG